MRWMVIPTAKVERAREKTLRWWKRVSGRSGEGGLDGSVSGGVGVMYEGVVGRADE